METVNIACFCQFLSVESSYCLDYGSNEEANNRLTHNLTQFQLISYYAWMDMSKIDHFTVNSDSIMSAQSSKMLPIVYYAQLFVLWVCEGHKLVDST